MWGRWWFMRLVFGRAIKKMRTLATKIVYIGLALNTLGLVIRTALIGGLPLNNGFEFGLSFVFAVVVAYVIVEKRFHLSAIGIFIMPVVVVISIWLVSVDLTIQPVMPALRSYWLAVHVSAAVVAYGSFALSFAVSVAYLLKDKKEVDFQSRFSQELPALKVLDEISYKLIFIGLPFFDHYAGHRRCMGRICLGRLLELGPQRNVGVNHLAGVCGLFAYPFLERF